MAENEILITVRLTTDGPVAYRDYLLESVGLALDQYRAAEGLTHEEDTSIVTNIEVEYAPQNEELS